MNHRLTIGLLLSLSTGGPAYSMTAVPVATSVDPLTRYVHIRYQVPADAPPEIRVHCQFSPDGGAHWQPAAVRKFRSATAEQMLQETDQMAREQATGEAGEYQAAGLTRTLIWQMYPQIPADNNLPVTVRIEIRDAAGKALGEGRTAIQQDPRDVVVLDDFRKTLPKGLVRDADATAPGWYYRKPTAVGQSGMLDTVEADHALEPPVWRPQLKGYYAMFVAVPKKPNSMIELRLTDDFYGQRFDGLDGREYFWRIARMDHQSVILRQPKRVYETVNDECRARLRYIRLVPVSNALYQTLTAPDREPRDKLVFGYFEPYSWAFNELVDSNAKFMEAVAAFRDARLDRIDAQFGRLGERPCYPSEREEPLLGATFGDATPGSGSPTSDLVGRMVRTTHSWRGLRTCAEALGVPVAVNFGSGCAYEGALRSSFAIAHPEWIKDRYWMQYKHPQVRQHLLSLYRELLEQGARHISVDFCRYPHVIDNASQPTLFLKELRQLADEFSRGPDRVSLLVRFPVPGVLGENGFFNPEPWVKNHLADYIVPASVRGNCLQFDCRPYVALTRGTGIKCLPFIEGNTLGLAWPGQVLRRVRDMYEAGADGVYIYQADAHIVGTMTSGLNVEDRAFIARLGSTRTVRAMVKDFEQANPNYSRDIYLHFPEPYQSNRIQIWIEGFTPQLVEAYVDGKLMNRFTREPYFVGKEGHRNDYDFIGKPITVEVRAKVNDRWLVHRQRIDRIFRSYN